MTVPNDLHFDGSLLSVPLWYPRNEDPERAFNHPVEVEIDLVCVRAADPIRISYDFDRNGYVVKQQEILTEEDYEEEPRFVEVAFLRAYQLDRVKP